MIDDKLENNTKNKLGPRGNVFEHRKRGSNVNSHFKPIIYPNEISDFLINPFVAYNTNSEERKRSPSHPITEKKKSKKLIEYTRI